MGKNKDKKSTTPPEVKYLVMDPPKTPASLGAAIEHLRSMEERETEAIEIHKDSLKDLDRRRDSVVESIRRSEDRLRSFAEALRRLGEAAEGE